MRQAECRCGQLKALCEGEPVMVAACHCLVCQRRTGSILGVQARFPADKVTIIGDWSTYSRISESGRKATYKFCPVCGNTIVFENEGRSGLVALPVGAFADPSFPPPRWSIFEGRKVPWITVQGEGIEHSEAAVTTSTAPVSTKVEGGSK
jgi:hypothetical protein